MFFSNMRNKKVILGILAVVFLCGFMLVLMKLERAEKIKRLNGNDMPWPVDITWSEPYVGYLNIYAHAKGHSEELVKLFLREDTAYILMPAGTNLKELCLDYDENYFDIYVDGSAIASGEVIDESAKQLQINYISQAYGIIEKSYSLKVAKSENLSSVFIETESGSMEYIDSDKANSEKGRLVSYSPDNGAADCAANISEIKAKGQSSFDLSKKNYRIKLAKSVSLLGMPDGKEWVLQANALDASKLRNVLAYSLAKELNIPGNASFSFADVYLNHEYRGNYLITQPVDTYYRNNISANNGSAMLEIETWEDRLKPESVYITLKNLYLEVVHPGDIKPEAADEIKALLLKIDRIIDSIGEEDSLEELSQYVDIDSLAGVCVMDALTNDIDAGSHSTFCFYDGNRNKLLFGPVWDYDKAWGNQKNMNAYVEMYSFARRWPQEMEKNREFRALALDKLETQKPFVEEMYSTGLNTMAEDICASYDMDRYVNGWAIESVIDEGTLEGNLICLKDYFKQEYEFTLNRFKHAEEYCSVTFNNEEGGTYWIKKGECVPKEVLEYMKKRFKCEAFSMDDGNIFDEKSQVSESCIIYSH